MNISIKKRISIASEQILSENDSKTLSVSDASVHKHFTKDIQAHDKNNFVLNFIYTCTMLSADLFSPTITSFT